MNDAVEVVETGVCKTLPFRVRQRFASHGRPPAKSRVRRMASKLGVPDSVAYFLARAIAPPNAANYYPPGQWLEVVYLALLVCELHRVPRETIQGVREFLEAPGGFDAGTLDRAKNVAQEQFPWMRRALAFHSPLSTQPVDGRTIRDWAKQELQIPSNGPAFASGLHISWARLMVTLYPMPIDANSLNDESALVCLPMNCGPVPATLVVLTRIKLGQHLRLDTPDALDLWRRITRFEVLIRAGGIVPEDVLREAQRQLHVGRSETEPKGPKIYQV